MHWSVKEPYKPTLYGKGVEYRTLLGRGNHYSASMGQFQFKQEDVIRWIVIPGVTIAALTAITAITARQKRRRR